MATDLGKDTGKPRDIELWTNHRLIHPLSRRLAAALSHTPVTPNAVSVSGAVAAAVAAACYTGLAYPASVAAGFAAHAAWHVLDGADGALARRTGRSSPTGELVDGICDYAGQAILYAALAVFLSATLGVWAWPLALASGCARALQANSYESRRREYQYWGYGGSWIRHSLPGAGAPPPGVLAALGRLYLGLSARVARSNWALEEQIQRGLEAGGERAARTRALYRARQRPAISSAAPLSANSRTIALGLSMAAGSPLWYFVYETVGLTLVLLWSLRVQRAADAALLEALVAASADIA